MNMHDIKLAYERKGCFEIDDPADKRMIQYLYNAGFTIKTPLLCKDIRLCVELERMSR